MGCHYRQNSAIVTFVNGASNFVYGAFAFIHGASVFINGASVFINGASAAPQSNNLSQPDDNNKY